MEILLHAYHKGLLGIVTSKEARIEEIKRGKPPSEHELRLRLLQSVPLDLLPAEVVRTAQVWFGLQEEASKARLTTVLTGIEADEWGRLVTQAEYDFYTACLECHDELRLLHKRLCLSINPDCPWDGEQIIPVD